MTILFLDWLWHDLFLTPGHTALTISFILLLLIIAIDIWEKIEIHPLIKGLLLMCVSGLEVYSLISGHRDPTWFLSSLGSFIYGMIILFGAYLMMVGQFHKTFAVMDEISWVGDFDNNYKSAFKVFTVGFVITVILYHIEEDIAIVVGSGFILHQLYVFFKTLKSAHDNYGNYFYATFALVFYLSCIIGLYCLFIHFLLPAFFAVLTYAFFKEEPQCCANCRTYESNGWCRDQRTYRNPDSKCGKYEPE